ncbi:ornithine cyclodeaminase family protein [Pseudemcibacter aquimaris]|uniref:ornithine cyclodeaminase family protein n=1 Tax=Pseudemcibacter aquimaris TaxID=2857064 RepID=UPI002011679D|nr:ornithine cyclodeaminase family protein [Pseudemcibacter aquimaris]MCC3861522.1 ornithine cyclodeaminase family protein [Pseudemcibacter aquimaris]WDU58291.1 ornithine cyclodeaminase family protein [Pseudemcibacter aquimaris]
MKILSKEDLANNLPYAELIPALKEGFKEGAETPLRHSHQIKTHSGTDNTLLIMPCWQAGGKMGIKTVMVCPDNHKQGLGAVQASYMLLDADTGIPLAQMDGDELTVRRTSSASALASSFLSNPDATSMIMMGAGKLAPHMIKAHATVRNLKNIYIWSRDHDQATELAATLDNELSAKVISVNDPEKYVYECDIISSATLATDPIIKGAWLNPDKWQHIDIVGGYNYDMREADNDVMKNAAIFVDTFDGAMAEAGDILRPIDEGVITKDDVLADLFSMVSDDFKRPDQKHTVFKSVGTALEDLVAANLAYNKISG